jgi:hypothetical protein
MIDRDTGTYSIIETKRDMGHPLIGGCPDCPGTWRTNVPDVPVVPFSTELETNTEHSASRSILQSRDPAAYHQACNVKYQKDNHHHDQRRTHDDRSDN